jgi:arylsulfatase A-like enzyme
MRTARGSIAALIAVLAMLATGCSLLPDRAQRVLDGRPNIILIVTDDLDWSLVDPGIMPELDRHIVEPGVTFERFFVDVSICCPSRASILRGQYAHNTGIFTNVYPGGGFTKFFLDGLEESTMATWLHDAGYRTGLVGKYLNGYPFAAPETYIPPGWDTFISPISGTPYGGFDYALNETGTIVQYGNQRRDYFTDVLTAKAAEFVSTASDEAEPFFLYLAPLAPHQPSTPAPRHWLSLSDLVAPRPPSFNERNVEDKPPWIAERGTLTDAQTADIDDLYRERARSMLAVDDMISVLVDTLSAAGTLQDTYIFFTSDNGFHMGQHRLPSGKYTPYEEDIRVPLFVAGPGIQPGRTAGELASNIDLAPTFADLAGVEIPEQVDGRSLVPLLRPSFDDEPWRDALLYEQGPTEDSNVSATATPSATATRSPDPVEEPEDSPSNGRMPDLRAIRTADFMYMEWSTGHRELYALRRDPYQLQNIAGSAPPVLLARLQAQLNALRSCAGDDCRQADRLDLLES